jgi:Tfp pilus assembly protein PilN
MKAVFLERCAMFWLHLQRGARRVQSLATPAPAHLMLDFAAPQRRPSGPGLAALLVGATLLCLAMMQSDMQASRIASLESELSALGVDIEARRNKERRPTLKSADMDERVAKANRIIKLLSPPWEDVFNTVESLNGKDIAVLSLEPELGSAQVRIGAEARNTRAMFEYLERMRSSGRLTPVVLQAHQVLTEDPHKPIRFGFTASWITAKSATN